jgi:hypothetical protein
MRVMLSLGAGALLLVTMLRAPALPQARPLDEPRSLQQVGVPADATRAAIPLDNP